MNQKGDSMRHTIFVSITVLLVLSPCFVQTEMAQHDCEGTVQKVDSLHTSGLREPHGEDPAASGSQVVDINPIIDLERIVNSRGGSITFDVGVQLGNGMGNIQVGSVAGSLQTGSVSSPDDIVLTYDNDGSNPGGDDQGLEVQKNGTLLLRFDKDGIELSNRDFELSTNDINSVGAANITDANIASSLTASTIDTPSVSGFAEVSSNTNQLNITAPSGEIQLPNFVSSSDPTALVMAYDTNTSELFMSDETQGNISSRNLKRDITCVSKNKDMQTISPKTFRFSGDKDDGRLHYGVVAEEIAHIMPELVRRDRSGNIASVRYFEMIPIILKELQERQKKINIIRTLVYQSGHLKA